MGDGSGSEPARAPVNGYDGFEGLFAAKRVPMLRLATLLVGSPAIAEEVVQDAFSAVNERWETVERPAAYLKTSVVNGCAGILRRRTIEQRYRAARVEVADSDIPEQLIDLRSALDRLSDRQRLAVVLRYFADLPDDQIAEALGVRPATVRSLVHRALAALRKELE
ncbi:MAG: sigma-70 family RNA polymerase sigma factor [Acidimicrobiaceae bacterium]|nr:sigma-70 family RNA polymerase sigma factor [Acidimicrobiaceae bacterium]MYF43981.1 sigma-70 family RNA polymerase sigma factor [Acidimicrobiaceae bacterium]MYJ35426.1 sigma-70 family RNA polymerase sigma factor [Acidimicrobiaceae bacterium]